MVINVSLSTVVPRKKYHVEPNGVVMHDINDCMAPYWGPRGAYVMSYQANAILKT